MSVPVARSAPVAVRGTDGRSSVPTRKGPAGEQQRRRGVDMDPVTHRRMRTAHLNHTIRCVCGRLLHGNGEKAHRRTCRQHLREAGWPLASSWIGTFVDAGYPGAETARKVEMGLGRWALEHEPDREAHGHPRQPNQLGWAEFKALVWSLADSREGVDR